MSYPRTIRIEVGPVPAEESCAQVGHEDYSERSRRECAVYIRQLQRIFDNPDPEDLRFVRCGYPHELGRYHEVVAVMTAEGAKRFDEAMLPMQWDHIARAELTWLELQGKWRATVMARPEALALVPDVFRSGQIPQFPNHPIAQWWAMGFTPVTTAHRLH